ncbi:MAG: tetratricopeptide repeat protein [Promethearchaeota archaeon]
MVEVKRIIVGGEGRVGIIDLIKKFGNISIPFLTSKSQNINYFGKEFQMDNETYKLAIWDFSGKTNRISFLNSFLKKANIGILVFELIRTNLINSLKEWAKTFRKFNQNLPIILVGTKPDISNVVGINGKKISNLIKKINISDYIKVSTITGENFELVLESLIKSLVIFDEKTKKDEKITLDFIKKIFLKQKTSNDVKNCSFKINKYLSLSLEGNSSIIYVNNNRFIQCKYLLLVNPQKNEKQKDINSIDESSELLNKKLEGKINIKDFRLSYEQEFWGHCSNLQAWDEYGYDTRLLHRNLAFPLLRKLTEAGDPQAKKVFKEEIAKRISSGYLPVIIYLIENNYLDYLNDAELQCLIDDLKSKIHTSQEATYWFVLGMIHMKKSEFEKANAIFKRILKNNDSNPEFWRLYGRSFCQIGEIEKSTMCFLKSYKLDPYNISALVDIGYLYFSNRRYTCFKEGIKFCDLAIKEDPNRAGAWYIKAENLKSLGKYSEAIICFKKTIEIKSNVSYVWHSMGIAYRILEKYSKAIKCFEKAIEMGRDPKSERESMDELISCYNIKYKIFLPNGRRKF